VVLIPLAAALTKASVRLKPNPVDPLYPVKKGLQTMLVLSRKRNEQIVVGDTIVVTVVEVRGNRVRLGIDAPTEITVHRREVYDAVKREKAEQAARDAQRARDSGHGPGVQ